MDPNAGSMPASSASSSRTVTAPPRAYFPHAPHDLTTQAYPHDMMMTDTIYTTEQLNNHYHLHHQNLIRRQPPPVPPARSSSLMVSRSPTTSTGVPSVQVIQPTPTKNKKVRRRSQGSTSTAEAVRSPMSRAQQFGRRGSAGRNSGLGVVDKESAMSQSRSREEEEEEDSEDSDEEKDREMEEAKKARQREKGRERQRRKRERDKRTREEARVSGRSPQPNLTISSHLPIPARTLSQSNLVGSQPSGISAPSSASSSYSPLPQSQASSYYPISPGQAYALSVGSTSVSGCSTPNTQFSPATSTPSYPSDVGLPPMWSTGEPSFNVSLFDLTHTARPRTRGAKEKARASSTSVATNPKSRASPGHAPPVIPRMRGAASPAKRRKSEPEPEEFRSNSSAHVGLGVMMGENSIGASWPTLESTPEERPKPRRTASDGVTVDARSGWSSPPTPPPLPSLPEQYRPRPIIPPIQLSPSQQSSLFAACILSAVVEQGYLPFFEQKLGVNRRDFEGMCGDLSAVFDKWKLALSVKLEQDMSLVSLEGPDALSEGIMSSSGSPPIVPNPTPINSQPTSPVRNAVDSASFFTPAPARAQPRRNPQNAAPTAYPTSLHQALHDSPLAAQNQHTRTRSLSSATMLARGINIVPQMGWQMQQQPDTPQDQNSHVRSDGTLSPSTSGLQTPSTGQGGFPTLEQISMTHGLDINTVAHLRSATDPTHLRMYTTQQQPQRSLHIDTSARWQVKGDPNILESPIGMTAGASAVDPLMPPPPSNHALGQQYLSQHQQQQQRQQQAFAMQYSQYVTSSSDRSGVRMAPQAVQFTPPTPIPLRPQGQGQSHGQELDLGQNQQQGQGQGQSQVLNTLGSATANNNFPIFYHPTFSAMGQDTPQQQMQMQTQMQMQAEANDAFHQGFGMQQWGDQLGDEEGMQGG